VSGCHNLSDFGQYVLSSITHKQGSAEGESTRNNFSAETASTAILLRFPHGRSKQHFREKKLSIKIKYHFENCRHKYVKFRAEKRNTHARGLAAGQGPSLKKYGNFIDRVNQKKL